MANCQNSSRYMRQTQNRQRPVRSVYGNQSAGRTAECGCENACGCENMCGCEAVTAAERRAAASGCGCEAVTARERREAVSGCGCEAVTARERREAASNCGCDSCQKENALCGFPLAMAYVPWQSWRRIYGEEKALCAGTIFEELDKPFYGRGGCNR